MLRKEHAGQVIYIPKMTTLTDLVKWDIVYRLVRQLIREGHSSHAIGRVLKISDRTVRRARSRMPEGAAAE